jgi:hypothetical protein
MEKRVIVLLLVGIFIFSFVGVGAFSTSMLKTGNFTFVDYSNGNITLINFTEKLGLWYHFDNESEFGENDGVIYDFSGNGRNATIQGAIINTTSSKYNYSLTLNSGGVLNNATLNNNYTIADGTSFTINFWVYRNAWGYGNWFLGVGEKESNNNWIGFKSTGGIRLRSGGNTHDSSALYILPQNIWTMVTISCSDKDFAYKTNSVSKFYINGTLISTVNTSVCAGYKLNNLGSALSNLYMLIGNIDELAIWETVLQDSDIEKLYVNTLPQFKSRGNYSQIYQSYNSSQNISSDTLVKWRSYLYGDSSINVLACVGNNYEDCQVQTNGQPLTISQNATSVKIIAELIADPNDNSSVPYLEMLEPPKLKFYVDNQSATCNDTNNILDAMNVSNPFCSIDAADYSALPDTEMIIKPGTYCDGFDEIRSGASELYPIIIRGENSSNKPILSGTCSDEGNGISIASGDDNIHFYNFEIVNFSNDALNIHNDPENIFFENITGYDNGYAHGSGSGDGCSFHEISSGVGNNLYFYNNYKSTIVNIQDSRTNYTNIYGRNNRLYGIFFYGAGVGRGSTSSSIALHYIWNATIEDSPGCLWSEVESHSYNITCNRISGEGIYFANRNNTLDLFKVNTTGGTSVNISNSKGYEIILSNGIFNENISLSNSEVILINVTYNRSLELIDSSSNIARYFYLNATSNINNTNITIINSTGGVVYSDLINSSIPTQTLLSYINNGGTVTNYSNYTITATATGYATNTTTINLTDNINLSFTLTATPATTTTSSGGGGIPTYYPTESNLQEGYSKLLYTNWEVNFKSNDESHLLKLNSFSSTNKTATITISSEPQTRTLIVGEEWKVNLDGDDDYDLLVRLENVTSIRANIFMQEINESISTEIEVEQSTTQAQESETIIDETACFGGISCWYYIGGGILILFMAGGSIFYLIFHKKK